MTSKRAEPMSLTVGSNEVLPARPGCSAAWRAARRVVRGGVVGWPAAVSSWCACSSSSAAQQECQIKLC